MQTTLRILHPEWSNTGYVAKRLFEKEFIINILLSSRVGIRPESYFHYRCLISFSNGKWSIFILFTCFILLYFILNCAIVKNVHKGCLGWVVSITLRITSCPTSDVVVCTDTISWDRPGFAGLVSDKTFAYWLQVTLSKWTVRETDRPVQIRTYFGVGIISV